MTQKQFFLFTKKRKKTVCFGLGPIQVFPSLTPWMRHDRPPMGAWTVHGKVWFWQGNTRNTFVHFTLTSGLQLPVDQEFMQSEQQFSWKSHASSNKTYRPTYYLGKTDSESYKGHIYKSQWCPREFFEFKIGSGEFREIRFVAFPCQDGNRDFVTSAGNFYPRVFCPLVPTGRYFVQGRFCPSFRNRAFLKMRLKFRVGQQFRIFPVPNTRFRLPWWMPGENIFCWGHKVPVSILAVPRIHLIVGREGLQGVSFFRRPLRSVCENTFFRTFSLASQSIEARQRVPVRGSFRHISLRILHARQPMGSVTLFSHTKGKRRLKNDRPCKPSRPTIKCMYPWYSTIQINDVDINTVAPLLSCRSHDSTSIHLLIDWVTPRLKSRGSDQLQCFVKFDRLPWYSKVGVWKILLYHEAEGFFPRRSSPRVCKLGSDTRYAGWRNTHAAMVVLFWSLAILPARP